MHSDNKKSSNTIKTLAHHIAFTRPLLLIPIWTAAILGFWAGGGNRGAKNHWELILLTTFLGIGIYGINQIFDKVADRENEKHLPLAMGLISPFMAWFITISGFVGALVIGIFKTPAIAILTVICVLLGIAYSAPPLKLKDRWLHALIANGVGHGALVFLLGYFYALHQCEECKFSILAILKCIAFASAFATVYIFTTLLDTEGDRKFGKETIAVKFGLRRSGAFGLLGLLISLILAVIAREPALFLTAIIATPFYAGALADESIEKAKIERANKIAVLVLAITTIFYEPTMLIPLVLAIGFAAIYYRKILGVKYP